MKRDVLVYFDLITSLKTTQEVSVLSSEIDTLLLTIFKSEKMTLEKALTYISSSSSEKIMQAFKKNNLDPNNKEAIRSFLDTLKDLVKKFKVIKITLAFDATHKTINKIHGFVKSSLGVGYILDIDVDETLLGGAVVIFNGEYKDYSIKKAIENTFQSKREDVLKLLA